MKGWCLQLETLTHGKPTSVKRKEVDDALQSRWEGVQVCAGRVLASWGDRDSIDKLRGLLESSLSKESGWAIRGEAVRALSECYKAEDIPWILDLYFETKDRLRRHELLPLITSLPKDVVTRRIKKELKNELETRRDAAAMAARRLESWKKLKLQRSNKPIQPTAKKRGG